MADSVLQKIMAERRALSVAEYMEICLQHPTQGYYSAQEAIGAHGDFITAPEISQIFGEIIAIWFLDLWIRMGRPPNVNLLELGPGRGALMADMLRVLENHAPRLWRVHLVEINPTLRQRQTAILKTHARISWHSSIETALKQCDAAPLFIVANEFFDALPIHQYKRIQDQWLEHKIMFDSDSQKLCAFWQPIEEPLLPSYKMGQEIIEVSPLAQASLGMLTDALLKQSGAMLIIDYGYTQGESGDTLQAIRHHRYHSLLNDPGLADISAHVDFRALIDVAVAKGAMTFGPTNQADFLLQMGILTRAAALSRQAAEAQKQDIESAITRLLHPQQMGALFKALAVTSPHLPHPQGFSLC